MTSSDESGGTSTLQQAPKVRRRNCGCNWPGDLCTDLVKEASSLGIVDNGVRKLSGGSASFIAACVIFPGFIGKKTVFIHSHHYPAFSIDDGGSIIDWILENPEQNVLFGRRFSKSVIFAEMQRTGRQRLPTVADNMYASAPTMTAENIKRKLATVRVNIGSGRKGDVSTISPASGAIRGQREEDEIKKIIQDLPVNVRNYLNQQTNDATTSASNDLKQRIDELVQNEETQQQRIIQLERQIEELRGNVLDVHTLCTPKRLGEMTARTFKELFGFPDIPTLLGFVRAVAISFGHEELEDDEQEELEDDEQEELKDFIDFTQARAKKATPSHKRDEIQASTTPLIPIRSQILIALIGRRTRMSDFVLAEFLQTTPSRVQTVNQRWIPRLGVIGEYLCSLPVSASMSDFLSPAVFHEDENRKVYGIVDARDVESDTIRIDSLAGRQLFSAKLKKSGLRVLLMIHTCGLPLVAAPAVFAKGEEISVCAKFSYMFNCVPPDYQLLADRGFVYLPRWLPNHNEVIVPAFKNMEVIDGKRKSRQFSHSQLVDAKANAVLRYTVEAAFSRSKTMKRADDVVNRTDMPNFNSTWYMSIGFSIFRKPLRQPHGDHPEYETLARAYAAALDAEA
jgi:hypothetical protein